MVLTKEQILAVDDLQRERVAVPEWGGDVIVRSLRASEKDAVESHFVAVKQAGGDMLEAARTLRPMLLSLCIVDEAGALLFSRDDVAALASKNAGVIERLYDAASRLNAMNASAQEDAAKK